MHVAILSDGVSPYVLGGIQRHSRMLAIALTRAGAEVSLFHGVRSSHTTQLAKSLSDFPEDTRARIRNHLVPHPLAGRLPGHYLRESAAFSAAMLDAYKRSETHADFIYAQGLTGSAFTLARRRDDQILPPIGIHQHGYEMFQVAADSTTWLRHLIMRPTFRTQARRADWVFSFPGAIRSIVVNDCGVSPDRIIEIPNGIEAEWIAPSVQPRTGRRVFVFVGRHERRKGLKELTRAINHPACETADFHIVGPIPDRARLRRNNIHYHGPLSDVNQIIAVLDASDVLICPSFAEGMPTVVIEAMARGLAVIATDVGATAIWVDERNGRLLARPSVSALRTAIAEIIALPSASLHELQNESLRRARLFSWDSIGVATLNAIAACLTANRKPQGA